MQAVLSPIQTTKAELARENHILRRAYVDLQGIHRAATRQQQAIATVGRRRDESEQRPLTWYIKKEQRFKDLWGVVPNHSEEVQCQ